MTTYTFTPIADPLGTMGTYADGINDLGQIVGGYTDNSGAQHGFLYSGGTYTTLDDSLGVKGTDPILAPLLPRSSASTLPLLTRISH